MMFLSLVSVLKMKVIQGGEVLSYDRFMVSKAGFLQNSHTMEISFSCIAATWLFLLRAQSCKSWQPHHTLFHSNLQGKYVVCVLFYCTSFAFHWVIGRKNGDCRPPKDLLSESKGSSGIGSSSSSGSSLKYLSGSRRNAGWVTSGSSFKFLRLKDLKVPSNSKFQGRRRGKAQWISLALWNDLMCFQIHFLKFTHLITQLVQLQWLPHPLSAAENKPRVFSVQRTKRNQGFLFGDFPFGVFFYNIPLKMTILQFWKDFNTSLLSPRKLYPLWNGIYFSVFCEQNS